MHHQPSAPAPFSYTYSPNFPQLLYQLNASVVLSTYQSGKVVVFSAPTEEKLVQLPRTFNKPMGLAFDGHRLAIATKTEVVVTANAPGLAPHYPAKPNTYDALYVPRATYYTGPLDLHDLHWAGGALLTVNTAFSCLGLVGSRYSFRPVWKPKFINELKPEDRCHLNGLLLENGKPKYVTALGQTNAPRAWKSGMLKGGILLDVDSQEVVAAELPVPHSPRRYKNQLLLLLSATGELVSVEESTGRYEVITRLPGFLRGMKVVGDLALVGLSKLRKGSELFQDAPIARQELMCGLVVVHIPSGKQVAWLRYQNSAEELYDVELLPHRRPNILNTQKNIHKLSVVTPKEVFWSAEEETDN
jgi:uncharacterized protein (TIGR03032 family)